MAHRVDANQKMGDVTVRDKEARQLCSLRFFTAGSQICFGLVPILFRMAIRSSAKLVELVGAGLHCGVCTGDSGIALD